MILTMENPARAVGLDLPRWSAAEVLDTLLSEDLTLRALIFRQSAARWEWSVMSIEGERGELIASGVERSLNAARMTANSEITKCVENALD